MTLVAALAPIVCARRVSTLHEWITMARDVWYADSWRGRWMYVFGPPGWSPDGSRQTTAMLKTEYRARLAA